MSDNQPFFDHYSEPESASPVPVPLAPLPEVAEPEEPQEETTSTRTARAGLTKANARKAIEKYLEVQAAPKRQLKLLAAALGAKADPLELAATIASATRTNLGAVTELGAITEADTPFNAVIAAFALDRDASKRVWALLTGLGKVSGSLPGKEATAATKIAEAAAALTPEDTADLAAVRTLGRK